MPAPTTNIQALMAAMAQRRAAAPPARQFSMERMQAGLPPGLQAILARMRTASLPRATTVPSMPSGGFSGGIPSGIGATGQAGAASGSGTMVDLSRLPKPGVPIAPYLPPYIPPVEPPIGDSAY